MRYHHYNELFADVSESGILQDSRLGRIREKTAVQYQFYPGLIPQRPGINLGIGWQEMLQLIAGEFDPESIRRVAPNAAHELFTSHMAYGPRIRTQIETLLDTVSWTTSRRQAVLFVAKPEDAPHELPCTLSIQMMLTAWGLETCVSMRSWDLYKGLPYDVMMFGGLALAVARATRQSPGPVTVTAASAHIYAGDIGKPIGHVMGSFALDQSVPDNWRAIKDWARQYAALDKGDAPSGIELRGAK